MYDLLNMFPPLAPYIPIRDYTCDGASVNPTGTEVYERLYSGSVNCWTSAAVGSGPARPETGRASAAGGPRRLDPPQAQCDDGGHESVDRPRPSFRRGARRGPARGRGRLRRR